MIELFRKALFIENKVSKRARGGEKEKKYLYLEFKDKGFYQFLLRLGITPAKSKTIQSVDIPDQFFADFLRGVFDGDGTFWSTWDKRWPNSFVYYLGISSASLSFLQWFKQRLTDLYGVKGYIAPGKGAYTIRYVKGDSRTLFKVMYYSDDLLFLDRKYNKIKTALDFDSQIKQTSRTPR